MSFKTNTLSALAAVSILTLITGPVLAADAIEEAPEPAPMAEAPVASWDGAYAGVQAGYGFAGRANEDHNKISTKGFVGGGFAGYNIDTGNGVIVGGEGDIGYSDVHGSNDGTKVKGGLEGSLRARAGYAVTPEVLPYVTAGGAARHVKVSEGGESDSNNMLGWTAGAGIDAKVTENVFVRGEYRYTDFGSKSFDTGSGDRDVKVKDNRVQFGVGMKF